MVADHVFFFTASEDPWKYVGMMALTDPKKTQKNMKAHHIKCENCAHCIDLHTPKDEDHAELKAAREDAEDTIATWLEMAKKDANQEVSFLQ